MSTLTYSIHRLHSTRVRLSRVNLRRLISTGTASQVGCVVTAIVLVAFGIGSIVTGLNARSTVHDNLAAQKITGVPYMTPAAETARVKQAGLNPATMQIPSCSVAGQPIVTGSAARCFAQYMNVDALITTHGRVYSQMPIWVSKHGGLTDNYMQAAVNPKDGQPVENPARDIWVQETALSTALNTAFMADQVSTFGIIVGVALLLCGFGLAVLSITGLRRREPAQAPLPDRAHTASALRNPGAPALTA